MTNPSWLAYQPLNSDQIDIPSVYHCFNNNAMHFFDFLALTQILFCDVINHSWCVALLAYPYL